MSIGFSLALNLGAGLYADAGPVTLKRKFEARWGKTEVFVSNRSGWDTLRVRAWRFEDRWSIQMALRHQAAFGLRLESRSRTPFGDMRQHRTRLRMRYADMAWTRVRQQHAYSDRAISAVVMQTPFSILHWSRVRSTLAYSDLGICRQSVRIPYWVTQSVRSSHRVGYGISDSNPLKKRILASWSVLEDARLQAIVNSPELTWNDQVIRILQATLSCDEGSALWLASIEVAMVADFAQIFIGDQITLTLGLETFHLIVDGKSLSRESVDATRCEVSASSPAALLDAPFCAGVQYYRSDAVPARVAVEQLIGPVTWDIPDWTIPAGRLMLQGATPLAAARTIASEIGAVVESNPDGSLRLRKLHPVGIDQYGLVPVDHSLFDSDVISSRSQIAPARGFNRVTVANEDGVAGLTSDSIEYLADPDDATQGTVRAYLSNQRAVLLTHTGNANTLLSSLGEVGRTETEVLEFIEGRSSTRYPISSIVSSTWQHVDLGAVSSDGQTLSSASPGYSLLSLKYITKALNWRVALATDEEVQFVLVDL